jgi:hypothetical protein
MVGSLKMNTTLEYSTRVVQEGDRRCKKSTLNDLAYLTPLRIPLMNPVMLSQPSFSSPLINEDLPAGPELVFTLNNRFFRHQACYSLLPAKPGRQADRVISLCKYKVVDYTLLS